MRSIPILAVSAFLLAPPPAAAQPATEQPPASDEQMVAELRAAVATMREEMFRPGPPVPGWNAGGADPDSDLRAAGADRHAFLLRVSGEPPSVILLTDRGIRDFAPAEWQIVDSYGSATEPVETPTVQFSWMSPRYVIGSRASGFRRGTVDCSGGIAHALLYEVPGEAMTEEDEMALLMFRLALLAREGVTTCTRWEGDRAAGWTGRPLLPDGRSLPGLEVEGEERLTIVPTAPLAELMRR
ncbi:MAG: hypothetical protein QOI38_1805 [Sphingomonadales bacterium]|jgi:hypothetical protein|nr:hypothetical protein [Sphingomonadales bacterium]